MNNTHPEGWNQKANENFRDFMESQDATEDSEASHFFIKIAREEVQRYETIRNLVEAESENGLDKEERAWLLRIIQRRINYALDLIELERA